MCQQEIRSDTLSVSVAFPVRAHSHTFLAAFCETEIMQINIIIELYDACQRVETLKVI